MSLISELSERLYSKNEISMLRRHYQSVEPEL